jgi:hypothetical protein
MIATAKKRNDGRSRRALPISAEDIQKLDRNAPIPTYEMDKVLLNESVTDDLIKDFRDHAYRAAQLACVLTAVDLKAPVQIASARVFFYYLLQICRLIGAIEKSDVSEFQRFVRPSNKNITPARATRISGRAARSLQSSLQKTKSRIENFTKRHSVVKLPKGNNRDLFTSLFIWFFVLQFGGPQDSNNAKLLAAAWRDLKLPIKDHRGRSREPLERWLSDRLRRFVSPDDDQI